MYRIVPDSATMAQVAALPANTLDAYAEVLEVLQLTPWNSYPQHEGSPEGAVRPGSRLDAGLARVGIELFQALPGTAERSVLLCTDLHPDNVLAAAREPWLVIDPKPYVGDPTYDPLQHMVNCPRRLLTDPAGFAHRMADLLGLDPARLRQWVFARCVQGSVDQPDLREVAVQLAP